MEPIVNGRLFEGEIKGGTPQLFPSAPFLTGRAKYPRGFTPERLREVQSATNLNPQAHYRPRAGAVAGVRDTLAASTAPVEHMRGTGPGSVHWYAGQGVEGIVGDNLGLYNDRGGHGSAYVAPGQERTLTVLHELGHHVSHHVEKTEHSAYDEPVKQGTEEAYAENYADRHFRDRRGRAVSASRKSEQGVEWTHDGKRGGPWGGFGPAFKAKRQESPVVQRDNERTAAAHERMMRPIPPGTKNHVFGQERLLDRTEGGSRAMGSTVKPHPAWNYVYRGEDDPLHDPEQNKLYAKRAERLRINPHI